MKIIIRTTIEMNHVTDSSAREVAERKRQWAAWGGRLQMPPAVVESAQHHASGHAREFRKKEREGERETHWLSSLLLVTYSMSNYES